jgi:glycosyltransferase involved in cell wall biosynthesis
MSGRGPGGRVALIHDFLLDVRGAERVFIALCRMFPEADLFTTIYDEAGTEGRFADRRIHTSFLQRLRLTAKSFRPLLPLYPLATEGLGVQGYDLVISSSSAWAHGVIVDPETVHVCYCHNPFRYAWNAREMAFAGRGLLTSAALRKILQRWREWDWIAAQRVDRYIANSRTTQQRIARYFNRESAIVYPPVETTRFTTGSVQDYYLVLSELMPHKRIGVAVEAFNRLGWPLVVAGNGPEDARLRRAAASNVRFEGRVTDERAAQLLAGARALVVTATEEFGIAAVEAQAAGRPVVALRDGGALETVEEGVTGAFFDRPDPDELVRTLKGFDPLSVDSGRCRANAERFDSRVFEAGIREAVAQASTSERPTRERLGQPRRARGLAPRLRPAGARQP